MIQHTGEGESIKNDNTINTIVNNGTIYNATSNAIANEGTLNTIINKGTIKGSSAITNRSTQAIALIDNQGTLESSGSGGAGIVVQYISVQINTINNSGTIKGDYGIRITDSGTIGTITNNGIIQATTTGISNTQGSINTIINNGTIEATGAAIVANGDSATISNIINNGTMRAITSAGTISSLNNYGKIFVTSATGASYNYHLRAVGTGVINIANYAMEINQDAATFNAFNTYDANSKDISHLVISGSGVKLLGADSRFLLALGDSFELGKDYDLDKLVTDTSGNKYTLTYASDNSSVSDLFSHLVINGLDNSLLDLNKNGNYFNVGVNNVASKATNAVGNAVNKSNISSVNILTSNIKANVFKSGFGGFRNLASLESNKLQNLEALRIARLRESLSKNLNKNIESQSSHISISSNDSRISQDSKLSSDSVQGGQGGLNGEVAPLIPLPTPKPPTTPFLGANAQDLNNGFAQDFKSNDRFYYNNTNDTQDSIVDLNLSNTQDSHK
ncbi:hypothetical protein CCY99_03960, partial [Helicobacter sp. 16-1353]